MPKPVFVPVSRDRLSDKTAMKEYISNLYSNVGDTAINGCGVFTSMYGQKELRAQYHDRISDASKKGIRDRKRSQVEKIAYQWENGRKERKKLIDDEPDIIKGQVNFAKFYAWGGQLNFGSDLEEYMQGMTIEEARKFVKEYKEECAELYDKFYAALEKQKQICLNSGRAKDGTLEKALLDNYETKINVLAGNPWYSEYNKAYSGNVWRDNPNIFNGKKGDNVTIAMIEETNKSYYLSNDYEGNTRIISAIDGIQKDIDRAFSVESPNYRGLVAEDTDKSDIAFIKNTVVPRLNVAMNSYMKTA